MAWLEAHIVPRINQLLSFIQRTFFLKVKSKLHLSWNYLSADIIQWPKSSFICFIWLLCPLCKLENSVNWKPTPTAQVPICIKPLPTWLCISCSHYTATEAFTPRFPGYKWVLPEMSLLWSPKPISAIPPALKFCSFIQDPVSPIVCKSSGCVSFMASSNPDCSASISHLLLSLMFLPLKQAFLEFRVLSTPKISKSLLGFLCFTHIHCPPSSPFLISYFFVFIVN